MVTCDGCCRGFYHQLCKEKLAISAPEHASSLRFTGDHNPLLMPTAHALGFLYPVSHKFQNGVKG